jgi:hypothetical protein
VRGLIVKIVRGEAETVRETVTVRKAVVKFMRGTLIILLRHAHGTAELRQTFLKVCKVPKADFCLGPHQQEEQKGREKETKKVKETGTERGEDPALVRPPKTERLLVLGRPLALEKEAKKGEGLVVDLRPSTRRERPSLWKETENDAAHPAPGLFPEN